MKCVCGYEEPTEWEEHIEVFFKSGPRKGKLKCIETVFHVPKKEDQFIEIRIEKDFRFVKMEKTYRWDEEVEKEIMLYACPKCHTVRMKEFH